MPTDNEYSLTDLADLVGVTPRTVRYYIAQGLLPSPDKVGPAARYTEGHLDRLRLIRRLQREHLPLAEIRTRLEPLDDDEVRELLGTEPVAVAGEPAIDYIRSLLAKSAGTTRGSPPARRCRRDRDRCRALRTWFCAGLPSWRPTARPSPTRPHRRRRPNRPHNPSVPTDPSGTAWP